jgi:hypothetical protein
MTTDSFGVPLGIGDYVLSASTTSGRMKLGRICQGRNGLMMEVSSSFTYGKPEEKFQKRGQLGYNVAVLCKADGTVPSHIQKAIDEFPF